MNLFFPDRGEGIQRGWLGWPKISMNEHIQNMGGVLFDFMGIDLVFFFFEFPAGTLKLALYWECCSLKWGSWLLPRSARSVKSAAAGRFEESRWDRVGVYFGIFYTKMA